MPNAPFIGEIDLFPFNFAPKGWALCDGQLLPISQNTALFSLLGTTYGGDGKTTFALPDLQGMVAMGADQGPGLSVRDLGETGGTEMVTLAPNEMPSHVHTLSCDVDQATSASPATALPATSETDLYHSAATTNQPLTAAGGSQPHQNMQPYLTLNYCIALQGVFPPRT
jgi:microcystin-dependent protein